MRLHVRELRAGDGVPIVCLHGWLGCALDFAAVAASDHLAGRTVLGVDLPGHGASDDHDREYGFEDAGRWVAEALGPEPVDLLGYSMGGRLALFVAGTARERVRRLALIGAHPGIEHPLELRRRLELDAERATQLVADPAAFLESWSTLELFGPATSPQWQDARARRAESAAERAFAWARALLCLSVGRQLSLWNLPYGLSLPTLYVVGSKDARYVDVARELAAQNPSHVSIALIGGAHHAAHLDQPDETARRIAEFF